MITKILRTFEQVIRKFRASVTRCERCQHFGAERYHQHTCYTDDERNWVILCSLCKEENDEYWSDRWSGIY